MHRDESRRTESWFESRLRPTHHVANERLGWFGCADIHRALAGSTLVVIAGGSRRGTWLHYPGPPFARRFLGHQLRANPPSPR